MRLAADIGGTFTDVAAFDEASGRLVLGKALSTPDSLVDGVDAGVAKAGISFAGAGLGSGLTDVWIYGVLQQTLAPAVVLRVNGGYLLTGNTSTGVVGITTARGHIATMAGSLVRRVTDRLTLGGEVAAAVANEVGRDRAQLQGLLGGNYALRERLTLDVGLIAGHFAASPRVGLQMGFSLDLPK